jgi:hypothetical protein
MSNLSWARNKARQRLREAQRDEGDAAAYARDLEQARRAAETPDPTPPTLAAPVIVERFPKNLSGDSIVVSLEPFKGKKFVDVRQWYTSRNGTQGRTLKGVCCSVRCLPELAAALTKALAKAHKLGLLEQSGEVGGLGVDAP